MLNRFRLWLRTVVFRGRLEREMHDEMAVHLARSMERLVASGMAPEEARRAARREFGHVESIQEEARDARGARGIESIGADVRFGLRQFARRPFSALTMIVVLAIGIGFNTALFVFLYSFVTSPPSGIERQESLVRIRGIDRSTSPGQIVGREFSYPEYREYAAQQDLFSAVAAWTSSDVVLDVGGNGERLHSGAATYVTANYFQVLGVNPILGVSLPAAAPDDTAPPDLAAVIGYVVPQENTDDYFDVSVHPADRASGVELGPNLPVRAQAAPPGYFALMGIRFVRGGDFAAADEADDSGSVVIGADLARRIWGSEDPIGRRFNGANPSRGNAGRFVVVGVVDEATAGQSDRRDDVQRIFVPHVRITGHLLIRTQGPAQPVIPGVRSVANTDAPELPLVSVRTLAAIEASQRSAIVNVITAIGGGGVLTLFLSAIGLYAVVTFAVGQRVREIGIRTALGADHRRIVWMFLFRGLRLSAAGLFVGLTLSVIVVRLRAAARGQELPAGTIGLAALIACVVIGVALLASWVPARRAAYIDPLLALRTD